MQAGDLKFTSVKGWKKKIILGEKIEKPLKICLKVRIWFMLTMNLRQIIWKMILKKHFKAFIHRMIIQVNKSSSCQD